VINEKNEKVYEFNFDEKTYDKMREEQRDQEVASGDENFVPGLTANDDIVTALKDNTQYEAVITKIDDGMRLIHISLAGSPGIIPFDCFKWAHKRSINENTGYYQEVTKPSTILKVGDLIYVQVVKKSVQVAPYLNKDGTALLAKSKSAALIRKQNYVLCMLDQVAEVQGAIFSMDAKTGDIVSYVGGSNYSTSKFNRVVQAKRQPGSAFKPILFAAALENGYTPSTIIMDTPEAMPGFDSASSWKPKNYDGDYKGPVTFRESLEQSRNIPTIKIADKVGVGNILKFANRIGFNAKLENNLSIALGTFGVSPRDMVTTFSIFANGGKFVTPKGIVSVVDRDGKKYFINEVEKDMKIPASIEEEKSADDIGIAQTGNAFTRNLTGRQVYDPRLAYIMSNLLKGVVTSGTGGAARELGPNVAGKTGTTNDYIDAWFVGFTPNVVTAVWAGFDDNKTLGFGETGGRSPISVWKEYMRATIRKYGDDSFPIPAGITQTWIEKRTGRKVAPNSPGSILESYAEMPDMPVEEGGTVQKTRPLGDDEYFENQ